MALITTAATPVAIAHIGRSSADTKDRSTRKKKNGRIDHCRARMYSPAAAARRGSWPINNRTSSQCQSTTQIGTAITTAAHMAWRTVRRTSRTEWLLRPSSRAIIGADAVVMPSPKIIVAK